MVSALFASPARDAYRLPEPENGLVSELEALLADASRELLAFAAKLMVLGGGRVSGPSSHLSQELLDLLAELVSFCDRHFQREEVVLEEAGLRAFDPIWQAHTSAHAELIRGFCTAADRVEEIPTTELAERVVGLIEAFWSEHHVEHDRLACDVLRRHLTPTARFA